MGGIAGRRAQVKVAGAPVTFTDEATTDVAGGHQVYQITAATKRVWDRATPLVVKVGGSVTGESYTYNRLSGKVTFATVDAGRGAVTVSGAYLPLSSFAGAKNFSYSLTRQLMLDTDFDAANTGWNTYQLGILDVEGTIGTRHIIGDLDLPEEPLVIQFFSDRNGSPDLTMWAVFAKRALDAAIDGIQDETFDFKGTGDDQFVAIA